MEKLWYIGWFLFLLLFFQEKLQVNRCNFNSDNRIKIKVIENKKEQEFGKLLM